MPAGKKGRKFIRLKGQDGMGNIQTDGQEK